MGETYATLFNERTVADDSTATAALVFGTLPVVLLPRAAILLL
jgi:hypothetical protein